MRRSWMGVAAVNTMVLLLLLLLLSTTRVSLAFSSPVVVHQKSTTTPQSRFFLADSDFSAFANSLEEDLVEGNDQQQDEALSWQAKLESMLDPRTSLAQRQILASELLSANNEIRESVMVALRDRKIDPLLTPTGKKLQDGTRAVARQLTTDIFPKVLENGRPRGSGSSFSSSTSTTTTPTSPLPPPEEVLSLLPKIGSRVLNALGNQAKKNLEDLQGDLADPSRIPERLTKQSQDLVQEAKNVFLETPEGLEGPSYTVVDTTNNGEYEIRDYEGYTVASTTMSRMGEDFSVEDVTSGGAAFNALAAYLFGANSEGRAMEMTTPVTTTSLGEMRFYLKKDGTASTFPDPLLLDDSVYETGSIQLVDIPPARLAVRKFTGFVTEGEVSRQKSVLLQALELDGWELDVPHGAVVPHVIFQYNPPYTLPMIRRNEIAVPIQTEESLVTVWNSNNNEEEEDEDEEYDYGQDDVSPSDY